MFKEEKGRVGFIFHLFLLACKCRDELVEFRANGMLFSGFNCFETRREIIFGLASWY